MFEKINIEFYIYTPSCPISWKTGIEKKESRRPGAYFVYHGEKTTEKAEKLKKILETSWETKKKRGRPRIKWTGNIEKFRRRRPDPHATLFRKRRKKKNSLSC